jgi:hypothetical protein
MIIIHDHHESIRVTCFKRGVAYSMEKYLEVIRTEKISIFAPITFIPCSECTPEDKKIQKKDTMTKHCIECLKDKELACFDNRDKSHHRFDTCRDCRKNRKQNKPKINCIECLKDKELACFDLKDKWRHRFDTCRDCRKHRKQNKPKINCITCLQDKELACFREGHHRFDTCQDCRRPERTKACVQCHIVKHVNEFGSKGLSGNKYDRCLACQHPLCGYCGLQLTTLWAPNPKAVDALPCCDRKKCRRKKHRA